MNKKIILISIVIIVIVCAVLFILSKQISTNPLVPSVSEGTKTESIQIGFSLGTSHEERWPKDVNYFVERAKELGAAVNVKYSGEDSQLQISQAENLIIGGAKVLVIVPNDSVVASKIVDMAHEAGIKIIA